MTFPCPSPPAEVPTRAKSGLGIGVFGALVVGGIVSWWICTAQKVSVQSEAELVSVRFGFPIPWITQDQSQFHFAGFPQAVELWLSRVKTAQVPTDYSWAGFLADALAWGAVAWVVGLVGVTLVFRLLRSK